MHDIGVVFAIILVLWALTNRSGPRTTFQERPERPEPPTPPPVPPEDKHHH